MPPGSRRASPSIQAAVCTDELRRFGFGGVVLPGVRIGRDEDRMIRKALIVRGVIAASIRS
jgi:hypothetical protein